MPLGLLACFRPLTDSSLFLILYGVTAAYFSGVMVGTLHLCHQEGFLPLRSSLCRAVAPSMPLSVWQVTGNLVAVLVCMTSPAPPAPHWLCDTCDR